MMPAAMEDSQPLATESFSYSWLINRRPSFDCHDHEFRHSLDCLSEDNITRERNHYFVGSNRFLNEESLAQSFNFDIPISRSASVLVHADEIFSHGRITPLHVKQPNMDEPPDGSASSVPVIPICSTAPATDKVFYHFLKKWSKSPKRILQKWFRSIRPLLRGVGCSRKSIRVDDFNCKVRKFQSLSSSLQASPQRSSDCYDIKCIGTKFDAYRRLRKDQSWSNTPQASPQQSPSRFASTNIWCDTESSIIEAVLHCKKSFGKKGETTEELVDAYPRLRSKTTEFKKIYSV